ncbi:secreted antigen 1 [Babesia divergens]|uniref:Secreted antigen 1 n=1 Tax=Babesia divergens TaxID=32595 RepID=A0AAD9GF05_BABDI|nr:secreted antigen 1 [Babesia divergens]
MRFLGILRASALFILVSAFHGPRGIFCSNLEVNPYTESPTVEVSEISEVSKESTVESQESLPVAKSGLVFESSTWDDSHLASSVLFLEEFCRDVISKKFNERLSEAEYDDVSRVCVYLSFKLESVTNHFAPAYGPGKVSERKEIDKKIYEDVLKPEDFDVYAIWLQKNIQNITESYKKMLEESVKLTATELKTETSMGPLKYGFVYNGYWWGEIVYWLPPDVYADTGFLEALNELKTSLDKIPKSPVETSTVDYQINEDDVEEPFSADVSDVSENLKDSNVKSQVAENPSQESSSKSSAPAPKSGLVFKNSEWDDSMLANAVLFLEEFCKDVREDKFKEKVSDKDSKGLIKACGDISSYLGSSAANLLCNVHENFYKDALKVKEFEVYIGWLVNNIPAIRKSIIDMHNESLKLTREQRQTNDPSLLSKYGFVFKGYRWKDLLPCWASLNKPPTYISESLNNLSRTLGNILKSPRK